MIQNGLTMTSRTKKIQPTGYALMNSLNEYGPQMAKDFLQYSKDLRNNAFNFGMSLLPSAALIGLTMLASQVAHQPPKPQLETLMFAMPKKEATQLDPAKQNTTVTAAQAEQLFAGLNQHKIPKHMITSPTKAERLDPGRAYGIDLADKSLYKTN